MNRRRLLKQTGVGYQEIEYIQSTDTQYIDTGITPTSTTYFEIKVGGISASSAQILVSNANYRLAKFTASKKVGFQSGSTTKTSSKDGSSTSVYRYYNNTFSVDGSSVGTVTPTATSVTLKIFAGQYGTTFYYSAFKLYYCKIYNGSTLIRDFIPVRIGNVGYLYDKVSGELFGNMGTGSFTLGSDIVPVVPVIASVYAYYSDGSMKPYTEATTSAIGVAVITSSMSFVMMEPSNGAFYYSSAWGWIDAVYGTYGEPYRFGTREEWKVAFVDNNSAVISMFAKIGVDNNAFDKNYWVESGDNTVSTATVCYPLGGVFYENINARQTNCYVIAFKSITT